ncbi:m-cresol methyl hydroxylase [Penicillium vulpinum]|uniref:m-cresol methyl hydroxylase n=1 Tax=Penicillium vulpinum TaxID=29845 RepID=UPI002549358A|nr:m-cresol methyl hydroxylase [Penicillium vulpinum]KAJ5950523.1 m-cresol methyl hydroxylase [Penicillium vulpinum]
MFIDCIASPGHLRGIDPWVSHFAYASGVDLKLIPSIPLDPLDGPANTMVLENSNVAMVTDRWIVKELIDSKSSLHTRWPYSCASHAVITAGDHPSVMHHES